MSAIYSRVTSVERLGVNLTIVSVQGVRDASVEHNVIANLQEDGSPRWNVGDECLYITEGSIIPEDVLKERRYWNDEKDRGYLDGNKYNRVKRRKMAGVETVGLLFEVHERLNGQAGDCSSVVQRGGKELDLSGPFGADDAKITEFLGITDHG